MIEKPIILCILLLVNCTTAQPENPQQPTCNNCCQGQTGREGNPGIPGVPGHPGNVGQKGDKGESLKGERGEVGSSGLKGEQGVGGLRGSPGKIGPVGVPGSIGSPGVKGERGEIGQSHVSRLSAFSAVRSTSFTPPSSHVPLPFEQFHTNVGDDFNLASGRFTCEVPGIYLFTYSLLTHNSKPEVNLMKDNTIINSVYHGDSSATFDSISSSTVLQLAAGDEVWLRCHHSGQKIYSSSNFYISFSGVLLHEL